MRSKVASTAHGRSACGGANASSTSPRRSQLHEETKTRPLTRELVKHVLLEVERMGSRFL